MTMIARFGDYGFLHHCPQIGLKAILFFYFNIRLLGVLIYTYQQLKKKINLNYSQNYLIKININQNFSSVYMIIIDISLLHELAAVKFF